MSGEVTSATHLHSCVRLRAPAFGETSGSGDPQRLETALVRRKIQKEPILSSASLLLVNGN